jgi:NAD(P)-dependent dehydrogenase (short-subunit alcohol dehydrogenase family)
MSYIVERNRVRRSGTLCARFNDAARGELVTIRHFEGASAIVSGGAGGLGEATVRRLHAEGLGVVIADLSADKGKALADELGSRAVFVSTDVTSEESILGAIEQAKQLGQLRYAVVAHGGYGVAQRIVQRDGTPADMGGFAKTIDLYLNGTYNVARLVAASVATADPLENGERGALVLTASIAGYEGQIGQSAYAAAKAGVIGLTIAAARDLSSMGIRVNTIAPGTMKTPMMESVGDEALAKFAANIPFPKRLGTPDEFADAATFLLSNGYVNGEVMRLDGAQRFTPR